MSNLALFISELIPSFTRPPPDREQCEKSCEEKNGLRPQDWKPPRKLPRIYRQIFDELGFAHVPSKCTYFHVLLAVGSYPNATCTINCTPIHLKNKFTTVHNVICDLSPISSIHFDVLCFLPLFQDTLDKLRSAKLSYPILENWQPSSISMRHLKEPTVGGSLFLCHTWVTILFDFSRNFQLVWLSLAMHYNI